MEQTEQNGKPSTSSARARAGDEAASFSVRKNGKVYARRGDREFLLGPAEAVHAAMADHLGQVDFGES